MSSLSTEGTQPPTPLITNTAIEETVLPAHHLQYLASPVVVQKGQSHWAERAHLSKGSTLHSLPTNTPWRKREGSGLSL